MSHPVYSDVQKSIKDFIIRDCHVWRDEDEIKERKLPKQRTDLCSDNLLNKRGKKNHEGERGNWWTNRKAKHEQYYYLWKTQLKCYVVSFFLPFSFGQRWQKGFPPWVYKIYEELTAVLVICKNLATNVLGHDQINPKLIAQWQCWPIMDQGGREWGVDFVLAVQIHYNQVHG